MRWMTDLSTLKVYQFLVGVMNVLSVNRSREAAKGVFIKRKEFGDLGSKFLSLEETLFRIDLMFRKANRISQKLSLL